MRLIFDVQSAQRNRRLNNLLQRTLHLFAAGAWKPVDELVCAA
jgi:hypothetical protein